MAKKKIESKKKIETGVQSKTARASMAKGKGKQEGFIASGEMDRIISLAGGEYLYLMDPRDGRTYHLRTGSLRYSTIMTALLESSHGDRIKTEMLEKSFPFPVEQVPNLFVDGNPCLEMATADLGPGEFRP